MGHIAPLRNQFKSINTLEQTYDYIKMFDRGEIPIITIFYKMNGPYL